MKALVLNGPGEEFSLETVPDPLPGPEDAVARVITCGAGLTIQHVKAGRASVDYPRIIGHEITGVIEAVGSGVNILRPAIRSPHTFILLAAIVNGVRLTVKRSAKISVGILAAPAMEVTPN